MRLWLFDTDCGTMTVCARGLAGALRLLQNKTSPEEYQAILDSVEHRNYSVYDYD